MVSKSTFTGLPYDNPVGKWIEFIRFIIFFPMSGKWKPVTPLLSIVFVPRVSCAYLWYVPEVVEMRRFYFVHSTYNGDEADVTQMVSYWIFLNKIYPKFWSSIIHRAECYCFQRHILTVLNFVRGGVLICMSRTNHM